MRCKAMRSAERGPMPGSLVREVMSELRDSGRKGIGTLKRWSVGALELRSVQRFNDSGQARQIESGGGFAHFGGGDFFGLAEGLVHGRKHHVLQQLGVGRVERLRVNLD